MREVATVSCAESRQAKDRLEVLEALIGAPGFDPIFRNDIIWIPKDHPVIGWGCRVTDCDRALVGKYSMCVNHLREWVHARDRGTPMSDYLESAIPLSPNKQQKPLPCLICGDDRPTVGRRPLCLGHRDRWAAAKRSRRMTVDQFDQWLVEQTPFEPLGICGVACCEIQAARAPGLCTDHRRKFERDGHPGQTQRARGMRQPLYDETVLGAWLQQQVPITRAGRINLIGVEPLLKAEIKYGLYAHSIDMDQGRWGTHWVQYLANAHRDCRSLRDIDIDTVNHQTRRVIADMLGSLRLVTTTKSDTRAAGYIELDHFGVRFRNRRSQYSLIAINQLWLRNLLWDFFAAQLEDPAGGRSPSPFDTMRRSVIEFSAYLEQFVPNGGHNPGLLGPEHVSAYVTDQKARRLCPSGGVKEFGRRFPRRRASLKEGTHVRVEEDIACAAVAGRD